ncbi:hypothetical protein VP01_6129g1, partial [Puccinia sorghi]
MRSPMKRLSANSKSIEMPTLNKEFRIQRIGCLNSTHFNDPFKFQPSQTSLPQTNPKLQQGNHQVLKSWKIKGRKKTRKRIVVPYISKFLNVKYNGHCSFWVVSYFLGHGHDHLAVRNKLYEDTKERDKLYKDKILSWILWYFQLDVTTAGDLIANTFKAPVLF